MKCNHCGSEWTTSAEKQKDTCPFCGKQITRITTGQSSPVDKFFDEQIRKIQEQQSKDFRWAKLLGCKPGEKPWIIQSRFDFIEDRCKARLVKRISKITDQELLVHIAKETNKLSVRRAAIKNLNQSMLKQLAYDQSIRFRSELLGRIKDTSVLEYLASRDPDSSIRMDALQYVTDPIWLGIIAQKDSDIKVRTAALSRQIDIKGMVEVLFDYIQLQGDLFIEDYGWPTKIVIYSDYIRLFRGDIPYKDIRYSDYGIGPLGYYDYWWAVDGSRGEEKVNQQEQLAEHINQWLSHAYQIKKAIREAVSWPGSDHEMHHYIQEYVEMIKKS